MTKFKLPLMKNNILSSDLKLVSTYISKKDPILTQSKKVKEFELSWSKWLGVKYSVFVNSGSSANLLTLSALKYLYGDGEVIVPTLNWSSDIYSIFQNNLKPLFCDISLKNLSLDISKLSRKKSIKSKYLFLTHAQGFNGISKEILQFCKNNKIHLIEDVCESHGAQFNGKKLGTFGIASNFSFYYAHHMSTIEGGMVCTNDKKIYEKLRIMRGHGLLREGKDNKFKSYFANKYKNLNSEFLFLFPGYNFRSTEINAVYGINQLKNLDKNNKKRVKNFSIFLQNLDKNKYFTEFDTNGSCNYAFILIFNKVFRNMSFRARFEKILRKNNIEFRRGLSGGGDQTQQPYFNYFGIKKRIVGDLKNTKIVHNFGYYIGNYPTLKKNKIKQICNIINSV